MSGFLVVAIITAAVTLTRPRAAAIAVAAVAVLAVGTRYPAILRLAVIVGPFALISFVAGGRLALRHLSEHEYRTRVGHIKGISGIHRIF